MTKAVFAEIISIGDELLIGQVVNTNASWIGNFLTNCGISVKRNTTISDSKEEIIKALKAADDASIVLITGGLGPTSDDITKPTVCDFFDTELIENHEVVEDIRRFFAARNLPLTHLNRKQGEVPQNCKPIRNPNGTAPGMHFEKNGVHYIFMPGVPYEMKAMMENYVKHLIETQFESNIILKRTILTIGLGESFLADRIKDWENNLPKSVKLAYLPAAGKVRLRLSISGKKLEELQAVLNPEIEKLLILITELVYGFDEENLEEVVGKLLKEKFQTLAVAESCTGGNISQMITKVAGSSAYFKGGIVAYSNDIKADLLKVDASDIKHFGAVSEEVAKQMAENVRLLMQSDFGLATTGIAGPDGGSEEKPVGTVWIALATKDKTLAKKYQFGTKREINIERTSMTALEILRQKLLE